MTKFYENLGIKIKKIRNELGYSQDDLAKKLDVDRVTMSKIENGDRKLAAEEVAKISRIFNIDSDVLLDLSEGYKVCLDTSEVSNKVEQDMRINVPQENYQKFRETLMYILNKVGSKPNIGETVLYKLLYFIDFDYYEKFEEQLIGAKYIKNHFGPTPVEFKKVITEMDGADVVVVKDEYFKYPRTKYLPKRSPDLSLFSANEVKTIDAVLDRLSDMNATEISEYSHGDTPWAVTENNQVIDYETVFYRSPDYSVREYEAL